ncbi:MAG: hypothetical protein ABI333_14815 [bacterium]
MRTAENNIRRAACFLQPTLCVVAALAVGCGSDYGLSGPEDGGPTDASAVDALPRQDGAHTDSGVCGNGAADPAEECDGPALRDLTCELLGYHEGTLGCTPSCLLDTSGCRQRCGNNRVDPGEECDGSILQGATCQSLGFSSGMLSCSSACSYDLTGCPGCGNGRQEPGEACDGQDFGGQTCNGSLACTDDCRIDATGCALPSAGTGADGPLQVDITEILWEPYVVSHAVQDMGVDRVTLDTTPLAIQPGDEVFLINLQGSPQDCDTVGVNELLVVSAVLGSQVVFQSNIALTYGVGGGNSDLTGQHVVVQRVPHFTSVHVAAGATLTAPLWSGAMGGLLVFRVSGALTVEPGGSVSAAGLGFFGGGGLNGTGTSHGRQGESICGNPQSSSIQPNGGGGGGGKYMNTSDDCGQGGGGAGHAEPGTWRPYTQTCVNSGNNAPALNGGGTYGSADLTQAYLGSGGGGGATDDHSNTSGSGGRGGGLIVIFASEVVLDGKITVRGADGTVPGDYQDSGNGGGGSGGTIYLQAGQLSGTGSLTALGGLGALSVDQWNSSGGDGGSGRIRIDYQSAAGQLYGTGLAEYYLSQLCSPPPGLTSISY